MLTRGALVFGSAEFIRFLDWPDPPGALRCLAVIDIDEVSSLHSAKSSSSPVILLGSPRRGLAALHSGTWIGEGNRAVNTGWKLSPWRRLNRDPPSVGAIVLGGRCERPVQLASRQKKLTLTWTVSAGCVRAGRQPGPMSNRSLCAPLPGLIGGTHPWPFPGREWFTRTLRRLFPRLHLVDGVVVPVGGRA